MSKDVPEPTFTIDDLLAELNAVDVPDGLTVRELCVKADRPPTKANISRVGSKIHDLVVMGQWECVGQRVNVSISGSPHSAPAYRPVGGGQGKEA